MKNFGSNRLFAKVDDILNNTQYNNDYKFDTKDWGTGDGTYLKKDLYYTNNYKDKINEILEECSKAEGAMRNIDNGELLCDSNDMTNKNSYLIKYIESTNNITKYFNDEITKIGNLLVIKDKQNYTRIFSHEKRIILEKLNNISQDLNNYQTDFLEYVYDHISDYKKWAHILVTIFYALLLAITLVNCFLLWAYSYFKQQQMLAIIMHIFWNFLKYFSFSFFLFGAAFGVLYKYSRDLIGCNMFLFSVNNLGEDVETYLLPNKESKEFLNFCINEEENNYLKTLDLSITKIFVDLNTNLNNMKNTFEINNLNDFSEFKKNYTTYTVGNTKFFRSLQDNDDPEDTYEPQIYGSLNFSAVGKEFQEMLKKMYQKFYNNSLRFLQEEKNITKDIEEFGEIISIFDCGFLKNEIRILYHTFYELSIESRILCALCCSIGFFGEIAVLFILLVMYHYNKAQFKELSDSQPFPKNKNNRNFDQESQNEFMSKSRPKNILEKNKELDKKFDKELDNDYNFN